LFSFHAENKPRSTPAATTVAALQQRLGNLLPLGNILSFDVRALTDSRTGGIEDFSPKFLTWNSKKISSTKYCDKFVMDLERNAG